MPTDITTNNPLGAGYQTGYFSGPVGEPLDQEFFNAAFASRLNPNPIYRQIKHCNFIDECGLSQWIDENMGVETDCYDAYTLQESYGRYNLVKVGATVTIAAYPTITALHLDDNSHFVSGAYVLPQVGNYIILTPRGELAKVTSVNLASAGDSIINLQLVNQSATGQVVTQGDELIVMTGSEIADCECPTGQFRFDDIPIEFDVEMIEWGDKGELCGKALHNCQWLKIPFLDECGNEIGGVWYTEKYAEMVRDHERTKFFHRLFNPNWGLIPVIKARGLKWVPASSSEITTADVRTWKAELDMIGVGCRDFAIFAGRTLFSQFQQMLQAAGVVKLDNTLQPNTCKWIDMNYCGISVEGLKLHVYEECAFSNGKVLGSGTSIFPASAIIIPLCDRPACKRSSMRLDAGGGDTKMLSTVYFRSQKTGQVWDSRTDSNGILGPRNTFGAGCEQHEWTVKSKFLQEIHCANQWGYMGLS